MGLLPTDFTSLATAAFVASGCAVARTYLFGDSDLTDPANIAPFFLSLAAPQLRDHFELATRFKTNAPVVVSNTTFITAAAVMSDIRGWGGKAKYSIVAGALYAIADWYSSTIVGNNITRKR
jgi:hypothetical protein